MASHSFGLNETHAPDLRSWVTSAHSPDCDFTIQNLPHGVFRRRGDAAWRGGVAIGDQILDMAAALATGAFEGAAQEAAQAAAQPSLNALMGLGRPAWSSLRLALSRALREGSAHRDRLSHCLIAQDEAEMGLPAAVGDFTDFFTSWTHMVNAGRVFNPDAPPMPNFRWLPIAYHGRSSSVVVSGTPVRRPMGQRKAPEATSPTFGPSQRLDFELELGAWIGPGNGLGEPILITDAEHHVFGVTLLNDWSARDVQGWEAVPLGPFLAKNFLTTVSPWVVTLEALAPYRCALPRSAEDPPTLPYLADATALARGGFDVHLEVWLQPSGATAQRLARTNWRHAYWSLAQMVTHHTEGGCNLRVGDLLGTGTQSGPGPAEQGCMLELSRGGREPVALESGQRRAFLEDGDTVEFRGWAQAPGCARIGFGRCIGTVLPAVARPADA